MSRSLLLVFLPCTTSLCKCTNILWTWSWLSRSLIQVLRRKLVIGSFLLFLFKCKRGSHWQVPSVNRLCHPVWDLYASYGWKSDLDLDRDLDITNNEFLVYRNNLVRISRSLLQSLTKVIYVVTSLASTSTFVEILLPCLSYVESKVGLSSLINVRGKPKLVIVRGEGG